MDFYVIAPSDETSDSVTLLKVEPLTVQEVNTYGVGHINKYTYAIKGTAYDSNGYGGIGYYSSATCGDVDGSGCTTDYDESEVKYTVDAWVMDKFMVNDLIEDNLGYKARLLTVEDMTTNLGYILVQNETGNSYELSKKTPTWLYNEEYYYWTMSPYQGNATGAMWYVNGNGSVGGQSVEMGNGGVVRPVVTILKSAL